MPLPYAGAPEIVAGDVVRFFSQCLFIVFEIVPALGTSIFSLTDYTGLPHAPINWVGLQNYHDLLTGGQTFLIRALQVTAIFSLVVTVVQNGLAVLIAWLLNARLRGQIAVRALVFLPVVLGATVNGLTWYFAHIRANQPATAMLYALIITALMGVVPGHLLYFITRVPV